jgi:hypothetical protein
VFSNPEPTSVTLSYWECISGGTSLIGTNDKRDITAPFLGNPGKLREINFPVSFLDFETFNPALPPYVGTRPYQAVQLQWSLHVKSLSGQLSHESFLCEDENDPRLALIESLLNAIPPEGAIISYSNYEQTVMKHLATEFPEFEDGLLALCERTFDLLKLVREEYYHPHFHGSFSIKSILPALIPDLGYGDLEIQHGLIAAIDFGRMVAEDTPVAEKTRPGTHCARIARGIRKPWSGSSMPFA